MRVPLDFDHPLGVVWPGYLMPPLLKENKCPSCELGYSPYGFYLYQRWYGDVPFDPAETGSEPYSAFTPEVRAFAERNVASAPDLYGPGEDVVDREAWRLARLHNGRWSKHLAQADVDALIAEGRLRHFTHRFVSGQGWMAIEPTPAVTAEQVNRWSLTGMGHDSISCHIVIMAACTRAGHPYRCRHCDGHGTVQAYPGQREQAENWQRTPPPSGQGWQLWEETTEGSPLSPVFATADELADWMSDPARGQAWVPGEVAERFIEKGWAPTLVSSAADGVVSGVQAVGYTPVHAE